MKPLKEKISITIDNDILSKLKEKAEYDDRSLSQYINIVLKQHIKEIEEKNKPWNSRLLFTSSLFTITYYIPQKPAVSNKSKEYKNLSV